SVARIGTIASALYVISLIRGSPALAIGAAEPCACACKGKPSVRRAKTALRRVTSSFPRPRLIVARRLQAPVEPPRHWPHSPRAVQVKCLLEWLQLPAQPASHPPRRSFPGRGDSLSPGNRAD